MRNNRTLARLALVVAASLGAVSGAFADLPNDEISVEKLPFPPDPHRAYIIDVEFNSFVAGRVVVVDPDKKRFLGMISTGFAAPSTLSGDGHTLFSADLFYSRGTRGERTDVLTAWDTQTLAPKWEVVIPPKRSTSLTQRYSLATSADDRFVYIYNFTPSTSVTVVNTQSKTVANEIDIPGCVLNYPIGERRFASLCGDGSLQVVTLNDNAKEIARTRTQFFDPNAEKLVERAARLGETYYFVTTTGTVRPVDFSGKEPKVLPSWSMVTEEERKAGWAPGGWQFVTIATKLNRMYALMHDQHIPLKWEDPSNTIWAFDLKTGKKVGTLESPGAPVWSINASNDDKPLLLGTNVEGGLEIFDLSSSKHTATMPGLTKTPTLVLTH